MLLGIAGRTADRWEADEGASVREPSILFSCNADRKRRHLEFPALQMERPLTGSRSASMIHRTTSLEEEKNIENLIKKQQKTRVKAREAKHKFYLFRK